MAEWIPYSTVKIPCDVGDLCVPIFYIDVPIVAGEPISVKVTQTPFPVSFFSMRDSLNVATHTVFRSNSGSIQGYISGGTYYISVFNAQGTQIYNGNVIPGSGMYATISPIFLMGSNGVASVASVSEFYLIEGTPSFPMEGFIGNTISSFGQAYRPGATITGSHLPSASTIAIAEALLNDSYIDNDPYSRGDVSDVGGGTGTFSDTGDLISVPSLPTLSATSAGFITLFNPSVAQMASLAAYMWTGAFDLDTFKKIFANPMDCILGLSIVPVDVPAGAAAEVKVGNIGTGISMTTAASQYVEVDCGTLNVEEFWGAYLDYDPYTKAEIYLPYIGTHPVAVDDIMGKSVHVIYHVDILSGACIAYIQCDGTVLYSFIGQCSSSIPISGNDWTNVVNGVLSIAGAVGSMVASGGATAPMVMPGIASAAANTLKPTVEKSGSLSGTGGLMGVQTPYLILTRPRQALPSKQNTFLGYPSFITSQLGTLTGYTEVEEVHLENMTATDGEIAEIIGLLKGGVIL